MIGWFGVSPGAEFSTNTRQAQFNIWRDVLDAVSHLGAGGKPCRGEKRPEWFLQVFRRDPKRALRSRCVFEAVEWTALRVGRYPNGSRWRDSGQWGSSMKKGALRLFLGKLNRGRRGGGEIPHYPVRNSASVRL